MPETILEPVAEPASVKQSQSHEREARQQPEAPLVRICPSRKWVSLNLRDLWAYRELLYSLTWRDVKVRYEQTAFGAAWAIIQPLF